MRGFQCQESFYASIAHYGVTLRIQAMPWRPAGPVPRIRRQQHRYIDTLDAMLPLPSVCMGASRTYAEGRAPCSRRRCGPHRSRLMQLRQRDEVDHGAVPVPAACGAGPGVEVAGSRAAGIDVAASGAGVGVRRRPTQLFPPSRQSEPTTHVPVTNQEPADQRRSLHSDRRRAR